MLTARGGMAGDRRFAMVEADGPFINGKREPRVHELRVRYDAALTSATFTSPRIAAPFHFRFGEDPARLARWLGMHFGRPVAIAHEYGGGFPDDERAPGPTVVCTATLAAVASWFPGLDAAGIRERLRANIEVDGVPAFWEDRLYAESGTTVAFRAGEIELEGTNPCARCIVPSRDPLTGVAIPTFAKVVAERRAASLPPWAARSRFDHFYRLAVNTRPAAGQTGRTVRVGDTVAVASVSDARSWASCCLEDNPNEREDARPNRRE